MPEYTHADRCMIEAETMLWIVVDVLSIHEHSGAFADRIRDLQKQAEALAREMRDYNDQFEEG